MTTKCNIRLAIIKDLPEIVTILNQAISTKKSIAVTQHVTVEEKTNWFNNHKNKQYPILVSEHTTNISGWISISPYRPGRDALLETVEVSYFIHKEYRRKGVGNQLLQEMILLAKKLSYTTISAVVLDNNIGSIKLLEKNNFSKWGHLPDVVKIENKYYSHIYYGKKI